MKDHPVQFKWVMIKHGDTLVGSYGLTYPVKEPK